MAVKGNRRLFVIEVKGDGGWVPLHFNAKLSKQAASEEMARVSASMGHRYKMRVVPYAPRERGQK